MTAERIHFDDGAAYEAMMGVWSRMVGEDFLGWLQAPAGLSWLDVGCGSGAFTALVAERCAPAALAGVDPSEGQLAYARQRRGLAGADLRVADAMALPHAAASVDAAVMALVIPFVPEPAEGVAELVRVVRPGGLVATYIWDLMGGGFPLDPFLTEFEALGYPPPRAPNREASRMAALEEMWRGSGLQRIETREITVTRTFPSFEELWDVNMRSPSLSTTMAKLAPADVATLRRRIAARLPADPAGRITYSARANAVKGWKG